MDTEKYSGGRIKNIDFKDELFHISLMSKEDREQLWGSVLPKTDFDKKFNQFIVTGTLTFKVPDNQEAKKLFYEM